MDKKRQEFQRSTIKHKRSELPSKLEAALFTFKIKLAWIKIIPWGRRV